MKHVREIDLIELSTGELPEAHGADVRAHLRTCPKCRRRYESCNGVHEALSDWASDTAGWNLWADIRERMVTGRRVVVASHWTSRQRVWRAAAAAAIAVGLGHGAGRLTWRHTAPTPPIPTMGSEQQVREVLSLGVIESPSPTGLFAAYVHMTTDENRAEDQP